MTFRYHIETDANGKKTRHKVIRHRGFEGYFERWTQACSGCSDPGDYTVVEIGAGCDECGYTGKRRMEWFVPLDRHGFEDHMDRVYARLERIRKSRRAA